MIYENLNRLIFDIKCVITDTSSILESPSYLLLACAFHLAQSLPYKLAVAAILGVSNPPPFPQAPRYSMGALREPGYAAKSLLERR
jgi:hypothetical protein